MKINAIEDRGTKRDFIDLFYLVKQFDIDKILDFYDEKYNCLDSHLYSILRSLNYFIDADSDEKPLKMIENVEWDEVKNFFKKESLRLSKKYL